MLKPTLVALFACLGVTGGFIQPIPAEGFCDLEPVIAPDEELIPPWSFIPECQGSCEPAGGGDCVIHIVEDGWVFDTITCKCTSANGVPFCHMEVDVNPWGRVVLGTGKCTGNCTGVGGSCEVDGEWPTSPMGPTSVWPKCDCR